jgi:cytochrome c2
VRDLFAVAVGLTAAFLCTLLASWWFFPPTGATIDLAQGRYLFEEHCSACHSVALQRQAGFGPNLARIGAEAATRRDGMTAAEYLLESLLQPAVFAAPGSSGAMPMDAAVGLSEADIRNLIAYLGSLGARANYHDIAALRFSIPQQIEQRKKNVDLAAIARGRALFGDLGCNACHSVYAEPGHDLLAPSLARAGQLPTGYIRQSILEPDAVLSEGYVIASVETRDGNWHEGRLLHRDDQELRLLSLDDFGLYRVDRVRVVDIEGEAQLYGDAQMPEYDLSEQEVDDLIAFLGIIAGEATGAM